MFTTNLNALRYRVKLQAGIGFDGAMVWYAVLSLAHSPGGIH